MDIGAAIKAPMEDSEWIKKCLIMGLLCLIPIVGAFNLLGWQREYTRSRLNGGTQLPDAGLAYIGAGFQVFLAMLPLIGVMIVTMIVFTILSMILGKIHGSLALIPSLLSLVVYFVLGLCGPLFIYRHYVHDDAWSGARVGWAVGVLKGNIGPVLMLFVIGFIAGIIGQLGSIALFVGVFLTMPLGQAIMANGYVEFAKATNRA